MTHPYDGVFAKFDAALEHFETLQAEINAYLRDDPYSTTMEYDERQKCFRVSAHVHKHPPLKFGTRIGDVTHNLASALDHSMFQIALLRTGREIEQTSFPIYGFFPDFRNYRRRRNCWMRYLTVRDRVLIQRFQPYRGGDFAFVHPIAQLYRLWNQDKHRTLHTALGMVSEYTIEGEVTQDVASFGEWHVRIGPVKDGADVMWVYVVPDGPSPQMKLKGELALTVVFGDEANLRVPHTLAEIGDWVQHIINRVAEAYPERPTYDSWKAAQEGVSP